MRAQADAHPRVTFVDGKAEATGLESGSVDLVICAQAFHWFKPVEALAEFFRILKPGGRLVFLANERDRLITIMVAGPWMLGQLTDLFERLFVNIPGLLG